MVSAKVFGSEGRVDMTLKDPYTTESGTKAGTDVQFYYGAYRSDAMVTISTTPP